jgi:hypothetical protein
LGFSKMDKNKCPKLKIRKYFWNKKTNKNNNKLKNLLKENSYKTSIIKVYLRFFFCIILVATLAGPGNPGIKLTVPYLFALIIYKYSTKMIMHIAIANRMHCL